MALNLEPDEIISRLFFYRRLLSNHFAFVIQLTLANMRAMAYMRFAGGAVCCQCRSSSLIVRSAFCASLLTVSAFRIWHNSNIKIVNSLFNYQGP
jgi:hypothetical protein